MAEDRDIGNIVYIIIIVVSILSGLLKKKKKAEKPVSSSRLPEEETAKEEWPFKNTTIYREPEPVSFFEKFITEDVPVSTTIPSVAHTTESPSPEFYMHHPDSKEIIQNEVMQVQPEIFSDDDRSKISRISQKIIQTKEETETCEVEPLFTHAMFADQMNLRKAFVMSEILNRREF
jgi:hypothetical protein